MATHSLQGLCEEGHPVNNGKFQQWAPLIFVVQTKRDISTLVQIQFRLSLSIMPKVNKNRRIRTKNMRIFPGNYYSYNSPILNS